jgi:hypothetical protein
MIGAGGSLSGSYITRAGFVPCEPGTSDRDYIYIMKRDLAGPPGLPINTSTEMSFLRVSASHPQAELFAGHLGGIHGGDDLPAVHDRDAV